MRGIIDHTRYNSAIIRDLDTWGRWFAHVTDFIDRVIPDAGSVVLFELDAHGDLRGPRATAVTVEHGPAPDVRRVCSQCSTMFAINAGEQAWFATKGYSLPIRCKGCRGPNKILYVRKPQPVEAAAGDDDIPF